MKILTIGDIVGEVGCNWIRENLPSLKREKQIDFVIANGENSAVGNGILPNSADFLLTSGVDIITTGNHVYRRKEIYDILDDSNSIIRPANFRKTNPGKGFVKVDFMKFQLAVINLMGTVYMDALENPFDCIDEVLKEVDDCKIVIVDFHAEATGEKKAMGFYLDGRVSVLFGTHTHTQTADEQILPKGTGYISDIGMTGPELSVLGVKPELAIEKMHTNMPVRFLASDEKAFFNGCIFEVDEKTGKTTSVERLIRR